MPWSISGTDASSNKKMMQIGSKGVKKSTLIFLKIDGKHTCVYPMH
jgi:hypothetical protein